MATCVNKLTLDKIDSKVISTYKELMKAATGEDSIYLKAKETLQEVMERSNIDDREKAQIVAQMVTQLAVNMTQQSMATAIDLAKDGRDSEYVLAKMCADTELTQKQVEKVEQDVISAQEDIKTKKAQSWLLQAQLYRDYGVIPSSLSYLKEVLTTTDYDVGYGIKHETIEKSRTDRYATYANTYRTNGKVSYTTLSSGQFDTVTADASGLTYAQTAVATRQVQGFDDNQRQHVVNSSASMIGLLLSTESDRINYAPYLEKWSTAVDYLSTSHSPTLGISGAVNITNQSSISRANGHTLSGTTVGISAGKTIAIIYSAEGKTTVYGTPGLVMLDGTWSSTLPSNKSTDLVQGTTYTVTARIVDGTGETVYDMYNTTILA